MCSRIEIGSSCRGSALADTQVRPGHLAQSLSSAPDEQAFRLVALEAGNGSHEAAEAAFLERGDRDQRVSGSDQHVQVADEGFDGHDGCSGRLEHG